MRNHLIVFFKIPVPGKVKTRLAKDVGINRAAILYKTMIIDLIHNIKSSSYDVLYYCDTIVEPHVTGELGIPGALLHRQRGNNLGERMYNAICASFQSGAFSVLLIGSDIPYLDTCVIKNYFCQLEKVDVVIGPAVDGGYYCIGFAYDKLQKDVFTNILWSTSTVYNETIKKIDICGLKVYSGPVLRDIDTEEDLNAVIADDVYSSKVPKLKRFIEGIQEQ